MIAEQLKKVDSIPSEIVTIVEESVINTFTSVCGGTPECINIENDSGPLNGIIGNIAVFNAEHTFSFMIAIPKDTAIGISNSFLGMELPFDSADMGDLIAELANIVAGEIAANIEKIGFRGQSSLPTATRGSDLTLFMPNKPPSAKLQFSTKCGEFVLNMALSQSQ